MGAIEVLVVLVGWLLLPAVGLVAWYWTVRLAVRAALRDAARDRAPLLG